MNLNDVMLLNDLGNTREKETLNMLSFMCLTLVNGTNQKQVNVGSKNSFTNWTPTEIFPSSLWDGSRRSDLCQLVYLKEHPLQSLLL